VLRIRDGKNIRILDHISKSLVKIIWLKMLKFFVADPESGLKKLGSGIRDKHSKSATVGPRHQTNAGHSRSRVPIRQFAIKIFQSIKQTGHLSKWEEHIGYDIKCTFLP
jgi:hypothetical protein